MVETEVEPVMVVGELDEAGTDERAGGEIVGNDRIGGGEPARLLLGLLPRPFAQVQDRELDHRRFADSLDRLTIDHHEGRTPRLVPPDDLVEGPYEGVVVEGTVLVDRDGLVVDRVPRRQLAEEPQLFLGEGEAGRTPRGGLHGG